MDLKMHLRLSSLLTERLGLITGDDIPQFWFKLGSIMPDISPLHRFHEHHIMKSRKYVEKYIEKMNKLSIGNRTRAFLLGMTSHYLADTFCLMHNHTSGKKMRTHIDYEKKLSRLFKLSGRMVCFSDTRTILEKTNRKNLISFVLNTNFKYYTKHHMLNLNERLIHDISYAFACNIHVLSEMLNLSSSRITYPAEPLIKAA